jgi:phosphoglycolate phosphatase-like HAD superfamily hydrolase
VDNLSLMPGFPQIIHKLIERRSSGETLTWGVLTGNFRAAIPIKLRAVGIDPDWFDFHIGSEDGKRREDLVACALAGYELRLGRPADPRRVLVIGDTPRDVACARAHGCFALGVATGRYSQADLLEAGADRAVRDLADPTPLLELL